MSEQIIVKLDRDQTAIVERACEFYSRVLCGQFEEISFDIANNRLTKIYKEHGEDAMHECFNDIIDERNETEEKLKEARKMQFPELNPFAHYGYGYSEITDKAFGIYQAIRYALAWHDHPEGGWTVNFDKPFSPYPVPEVEIKNEENINNKETYTWKRELIRNEKGGCIGAKMICPKCNKDNKHDEYMAYCPNCGAKMVEPQEREEK